MLTTEIRSEGANTGYSPLTYRHVLPKVRTDPMLRDQIDQVNMLTEGRCITSKISSGSLDRNEDPCMRNCVDRFMDANMTVIKHLEQLRTMG